MEDNLVKAIRYTVEGGRSRVRQRLRWKDGVERDMMRTMMEEDIHYWRQHTRRADPIKKLEERK